MRSEKRIAGQMTVEFAVAFPVIAMIAAIACLSVAYMGFCASFDGAARNAMRLEADDGNDAAASAEIADRIAAATGIDRSCISVDRSRMGLGHMRYTATFSFDPSLVGLHVPTSIFGIEMPMLTHECSLVVSPYRKGVVV